MNNYSNFVTDEIRSDIVEQLNILPNNIFEILPLAIQRIVLSVTRNKKEFIKEYIQFLQEMLIEHKHNDKGYTQGWRETFSFMIKYVNYGALDFIESVENLGHFVKWCDIMYGVTIQKDKVLSKYNELGDKDEIFKRWKQSASTKLQSIYKMINENL
eukprot:123167_1